MGWDEEKEVMRDWRGIRVGEEEMGRDEEREETGEAREMAGREG